MKYQTSTPSLEWSFFLKEHQEGSWNGGERKSTLKPADFLLLYSEGVSEVPQQRSVPVLLPEAWYFLWNLFSVAFHFSSINPFQLTSPILDTDSTSEHPRYTLHNTDWVFSRTKPKRKGKGKRMKRFLQITAELCFRTGNESEKRLFSEVETWSSAESTSSSTLLSHSTLLPQLKSPRGLLAFPPWLLSPPNRKRDQIGGCS